MLHDLRHIWCLYILLVSIQMKSVLYISAEVSGENRLLLATRGIVPREAMMKQGMARPAQA